MAGELELRADVSAYSGLSIPSNLARLTELCEERAAEYRGIEEIGPRYEYKDAKRDRAAVRAAIKQVEDERKRVKGAFTMPLLEFESGVKSALRPLGEVEGKLDALIKAYEARARAAKRERLERYWESTYPALALCTGEDEEPLVPFDRVMAVIGGDWLKRMSEVGEGHDALAERRMDDLAANLASGAEVISGLSEPEEVRRAALSELYRCFNPVQAIDAAKREARRRADIDRLGEAQAATGVPPVEAPWAPATEEEPSDVTPAADSGEAGAPAGAYQMPEKGSFEPVGYVVIPIRDAAHKRAVIAAMRAAGVSGSFRRAERARGEEGAGDGR